MKAITLPILALALGLSACATVRTGSAPVLQTFSWQSPAGKKYFVSGSLTGRSESGLLETKIGLTHTVLLNGAATASGQIDPATQSGTVSGSIDGVSIVSACTGIRRTRDWIDVTCDVIADGDKIGSLKF